MRFLGMGPMHGPLGPLAQHLGMGPLHGPLGPLALTDLARLPGLLCLGSAELVLPCSLPCFALPMLPTSLIRESTKGGGRRPPPFVEAAEGRLPYVLPQQRSCLATTEILSCHNTHLVLPQQTSLGAARRRRRASIPGHIPDQHAQEKISA